MTYAFPLTAFSDNVPMTVPSVSKLEPLGVSGLQGWIAQSAYLVLMYFPSLVLSLSLVAFSEPARSIKL